MKRFSKALRFNLNYLKKTYIILGLCCIGFILLLIFFQAVLQEKIVLTGIDSFLKIASIIMGISTFTYCFTTLTANSISRKSFVLSTFTSFVIIAVILCVFELILTGALIGLDLFETKYYSSFDGMFHVFSQPYDYVEGDTVFHTTINNIDAIYANLTTFSDKIARIGIYTLFNFVVYMCALISGFFFSVVFYRIPKVAKIILGVFIWFLICVFPTVVATSNLLLFKKLGEFFSKNIWNNSTGMIITLAIISVVLGTASYFITIKTPLKKVKVA